MALFNAFERISNAYYHLTAAEKKVADYVIIHQRDTQYMSISELAEACGVAEATVSRFSKRLGYKGYNAFKLAVANATSPRGGGNPLSGEITPEDTVFDMCQKLYTANLDAMEQTLGLLRPEAVKAAGDLLERADKVLCMGQGWSMLAAQEAAQEAVSRAAQIAAARRGASRAGAIQAGIRRMKNIDGLYNICTRKPGCRLTLGLFKDII